MYASMIGWGSSPSAGLRPWCLGIGLLRELHEIAAVV